MTRTPHRPGGVRQRVGERFRAVGDLAAPGKPRPDDIRVRALDENGASRSRERVLEVARGIARRTDPEAEVTLVARDARVAVCRVVRRPV